MCNYSIYLCISRKIYLCIISILLKNSDAGFQNSLGVSESGVWYIMSAASFKKIQKKLRERSLEGRLFSQSLLASACGVFRIGF